MELYILFYLTLIFIDLLFFLSLARLLSYKRQTRWLTKLNSKAKPLLDWFVGYIEKGMSRLDHKTYSQKALLVIGMLTLLVVRFLLVSLFSE